MRMTPALTLVLCATLALLTAGIAGCQTADPEQDGVADTRQASGTQVYQVQIMPVLASNSEPVQGVLRPDQPSGTGEPSTVDLSSLNELRLHNNTIRLEIGTEGRSDQAAEVAQSGEVGPTDQEGGDVRAKGADQVNVNSAGSNEGEDGSSGGGGG